MDEQLKQLVERIHQAQNILVTVSSNPSVDQLAAAIGLTLALNKLDKHGTAVFSGEVPSTIEFLKPEETLEKDTNSLRDFIIALDKSKADKLRYKVEDNVVRIFITPYRTSLSQDDLQFSQGDFNVDVVLALGVHEQQDLDGAITSHGRILHDATVASIGTQAQGSLGSINWVDQGASSLSEMMVELINGLDKKLFDPQISTALLTGIVSSTERFRNDKTSPKTMSASAALMAAGANQQLIATQLEAPAEPAMQTEDSGNGSDSNNQPPVAPREPGTLEIDHQEPDDEPFMPSEPKPEEPQAQVRVDDNGELIVEGTENQDLPQISKVRGVDQKGNPTAPESESDGVVKRERMVAPPQMGDNDITANSKPEAYDLSTEELTLPAMDSPLLSHNQNVLEPTPEAEEPNAEDKFIPQAPLSPPTDLFSAPDPAAQQIASAPPFTMPAPQPPSFEPSLPPAPTTFTPSPSAPFTPLPSFQATPAPAFDFSASTPPTVRDDKTLAEIEQSLGSPHAIAPPETAPESHVDQARNAVEAALNGATSPPIPEPIAALNAQPLGETLHPTETPLSAGLPPATQLPTPAGGVGEPLPGSSPSDAAMDMPLPTNPFGPGAQPSPVAPSASPSAFPGAPQPGSSGQAPPPPVPPPMLPPLQ